MGGEKWKHCTPGVVGYVGHRPFSWSKQDPVYDGPFALPKEKKFEAHISSYGGHRPINWVPAWRSTSVPASQRMLTGTGHEADQWFGSIGSPTWRSGIGRAGHMVAGAGR